MEKVTRKESIEFAENLISTKTKEVIEVLKGMDYSFTKEILKRVKDIAKTNTLGIIVFK